MKKIGYENKENLRNNPNIAEKNKVTDENMNEIKEVVNYNANESENVKDALIHITTEKSSNINVKDSSDLNAKIDVFGISEQETRSGYNLFNNTKTISNVTYNSEEDKWVFNLPGKYDHIASKGTFFKNIKANTNYTIYLNILKNTTNNIITFNTDKTVWNAYFNIQAGKTGIIVNNIKTKEDLSTALYDLWFSHPNTITGEFEAQIMLYEGTEGKHYEQYGASPSPEFPSEIQNVTGDIDITLCNKNLANSSAYNYDTVSYQDLNVNLENNEFTISTDSLRIITEYVKVPIKITENGTYTFGLELKANKSGTEAQALVYDSTNKKTVGSILQNNTNTYVKKSATITIDDTVDKSNINVLLYCQGTVGNAYSYSYKNIFVNLGQDTNFVPHKEQLITFPLAEGQRLADGDKLASDGIHHVRKQIEFNGTENWIKNVNYTTETILAVQLQMSDAVAAASNTLCNYFKYNSDNTTANTYRFATKYLLIKLDVSEFSTIEAFKTWLAEQKQTGTPVIVEYELATEEIEPYTEEQQKAYDKLQNVLSYKPETNVFTNQGLLEFKYIADTKTYIDNKYNNLAQQFLNL